MACRLTVDAWRQWRYLYQHCHQWNRVGAVGRRLFALTWRRPLFKAWKKHWQQQRRIAQFVALRCKRLLQNTYLGLKNRTRHRLWVKSLERTGLVWRQVRVWRFGVARWLTTLHLCRKANNHNRKRVLKITFRLWRQHVRVFVNARSTAMSSLLHWKHSLVAKVWRRWTDCVLRRKRLVRLAASVRRSIHLQAFQRWRVFVGAKRLNRRLIGAAQLVRKRHLFKRWKRVTHQLVAWNSATTRLKKLQKKHVLRACVKSAHFSRVERLLSAKVRLVTQLSHWSFKECSQRYVYLQVRARWLQLTFEGWRRGVEAQFVEEAVLTSSLSSSKAFRLFGKWRRLMHIKRHGGSILNVVDRALAHRRRRTCFHAWSTFTSLKQQCREQAYGRMRSIQAEIVSQAFHVWVSVGGCRR